MQVYNVCEQLPGANSSPYSDCHQTSSVMPLATGDEVTKFRKVTVGGGRMSSTERPVSFSCFPGIWFYGVNANCGTDVGEWA